MNPRSPWLPVAMCALLAGCGTTPLTNMAGEFQAADAVAIPALKRYFAALNGLSRGAWVDDQVARRQRIDLRQLEDKWLLSPSDLQARMNALDALLKYSGLLAKLASAGTAASVSGSIADLQGSLGTVEADAAKLAGSPAQVNKEFAAVTKGFAALADAVAASAIAGKINTGLVQAVQTADPGVQRLTTALANDLRDAANARRDFLSAARVNATDAYDGELRKPAVDAIRLAALANGIKLAEGNWDTMNSAAPVDMIVHLGRAHHALVEAAKHPKDPAAVQSAEGEIAGFRVSVLVFAEFVNSLPKV